MPTTDSSRKTLYLIDGSAYIYRAFFALPALNNSKGLQTNAVYGFTTMLLKLVRERAPKYLAVAFDPPGRTFRHERYAEYKATREKMPPELVEQMPRLREVVRDAGARLTHAKALGYEWVRTVAGAAILPRPAPFRL